MSAQVEAEADPLEPEMKARYPDQSSIQPTQRDCDRLSRSLTITSASTAASSAPPERSVRQLATLALPASARRTQLKVEVSTRRHAGQDGTGRKSSMLSTTP